MLKQLLITLLVAVVVVVIARMKRPRMKNNRGQARPTGADALPASTTSSRSTTMLVGYALAAVMIITTAGISWMRYQEANEIVRVEVVDARSGERTIYQVRRKELGDREFQTVDGLVVSLGASDRMVRVE